ncbi:acyltransferase [Microlunatus soli]|uniref:Surface polysaccharide O-acyltransferase, integral membrane enzyme n=1 Tax=Microlunatus soli TaxID=630515 RepID=A0A1H2AAH5_9ACTN|nr:acyltransferase [Microlunatus soli]SDT42887.1 Surface polysaccharide O-acyltransferase, integral membrane enzyme [Microlunatus soli]
MRPDGRPRQLREPPSTARPDSTLPDSSRPDSIRPDSSRPDSSRRAAGQPRRRDIDAMRVIVFSCVIAAHVVTYVGDFERRSVAAWGMAMHFTRYAFVFISALVLMYGYRDRELAPARFWRRRFGAVVLPYVAWSCIYYAVELAVDGRPGWWPGITRLTTQLLTGGVWYHLYFLLISIQLYAVFPLLHRLVRGASIRRSVAILVGGAVLQLGSMAAVSLLPAPHSIAGYPWRHPDTQLPIYAFFIAAGMLTALHRDRVDRWIRARPVLISVLFGVGVVVTMGVFLIRSSAGSAMLASLPAFPTILPWAAGATLVVYALCITWDRRAPAGGRTARLAAAGAHRAFGVFALHPLVLWALDRWLLPALNAAGVGTPTEMVILFVGTVLGTVLLVELLLRTPLSKVLTARPRMSLRRSRQDRNDVDRAARVRSC